MSKLVAILICLAVTVTGALNAFAHTVVHLNDAVINVVENFDHGVGGSEVEPDYVNEYQGTGHGDTEQDSGFSTHSPGLHGFALTEGLSGFFVSAPGKRSFSVSINIPPLPPVYLSDHIPD